MSTKPSLYDELMPLIIEWISQHPKYGPLDEALKHRGMCHQIIYLNLDGCVYPYPDIDKCDYKIQYTDPNFFDKISESIENHITGCEVCKELSV